LSARWSLRKRRRKMAMFVKVLAFAFLASVPFNILISAQTNPEKPRFLVTITQKAAVGSDIVIGINITNISGESIITTYGYSGDLPQDYEYDVRDERGIALAEQPDARRIYESTKPEQIEMKPGQSMDTTVEISDYFLFDHSGKYKIQISRKEPGMPKVDSNILAVNLVDAPQGPQFTLNVNAVNPVIALGSDVVVDVFATNTSEKPVWIPILGWRGSLIDSIRYDVRDEKGVPVASYVQRYAKLSNGKTIPVPTRLPGSHNGGSTKIMPGKSDEIQYEGRISEVYSFDHLGKYTVRASIKAPGMPVVHSNTITITVIAPLRKRHARQ
jgi:hypothetical protein